MHTNQQIIRMILDADPSLTASNALMAYPTASVRKLLAGCTLTTGPNLDIGGSAPGITLTFDADTRLTKATWSQVFPDLDRSHPVFQALHEATRQTVTVRAVYQVVIGTKKVKSKIAYRWKQSNHESLTLVWAQPKTRAAERVVLLERRFIQPHASVAAMPLPDTG